MQVKRIAGALGAELSGIDLRQPLDKDAAAQFLAFAQAMGELRAAHPGE
jgi:hypothetical protein